MIVGACVLPTAPLLVPGVAAQLPPGCEAVADAVDIVVEQLPSADAVVLLAPGDSTTVHDDAVVSLGGIGRPDITEQRSVATDLVEPVALALGAEIAGDTPLSLPLAVLALLLGNSAPLVPVTVQTDLGFERLSGAGRAVAQALGEPGTPDVVVVASGDLSAGIGPASPRPGIAGAQAFDEQVVEIVDSGRLDRLAELGPKEARRVHASGWAPLVVLHGVVAHAKIALVRRRYAAPCGVGYLVGHGA